MREQRYAVLTTRAAQECAGKIISHACSARIFRNIFRVKIRDRTGDSLTVQAAVTLTADARATVATVRKCLFSRVILHVHDLWVDTRARLRG